MFYENPVTLYFQRNDGKMGSLLPISCHVDRKGLRIQLYAGPSRNDDLAALKGQGPRWMALGLGDSVKKPRLRGGRPVLPKARTFIEFGAKVTRTKYLMPDVNCPIVEEVAMLLCGPTKMHLGSSAPPR